MEEADILTTVPLSAWNGPARVANVDGDRCTISS